MFSSAHSSMNVLLNMHTCCAGGAEQGGSEARLQAVPDLPGGPLQSNRSSDFSDIFLGLLDLLDLTPTSTDQMTTSPEST